MAMYLSPKRKRVPEEKAAKDIGFRFPPIKGQRILWHWVRCGVLLLLFKSCSNQVAAQTIAQKSFIAWPQVKDGFFPRMSEDGRRVAVRVGRAVQVWTIESDGQLGKMVWDSNQNYPKLVAHGFAWRGGDLILSLGDNRDPLYRLDYFSKRDVGQLPASKGTTLLIDLQSGKATELLTKSYRYLTVDPTRKYMAAVTPTEIVAKDTLIEFYELDGRKAKLDGRFEKKGGRTSNLSPYISGWSSASKGVYFIGKRDRKSATDPNAYYAMFHITRDGKRSEILPEKATVTPLRRGAPPLASVVKNQDLSVLIQYLSQGGEYVIVNLEGIQKSTRFVEGKSLLNGKIARPQALAMTPNGRFIVFQDLGKNLDPPPGYQVGIWILDTKSQRARKATTTEAISSVHQWSGNRLLVEIDDMTGESHALGLLHIQEATINPDDPKLDALVAQAPWEDTVPPKPPKSAPQLAAETFLRQPPVVPLNLPEQWEAPFSKPADWKDLTVYAIGTPNQDSHFIAVDPKINRVVAFTAPPPRPPLPPEPIPPARAQELAQEFARAHQGELFKPGAEVKIEVEPQITARAAYVVHLQRSEAGVLAPLRVTVEVRAGDGKIAAYRESTEPATNMAKSPARGSTPVGIVDQAPRWSPDGKQIAFLSNRPRAGYPSWWSGRPQGLYMVNADGSGLRLVAAEAASPAHWSPDNRRLAYRLAQEVRVYDLTSKTTVVLPRPADRLIEQRLFGWLSATQVLLGWVHNGPGHCDLVSWQPTQSQQPPVVLVKDWSAQIGNDWGAGGFALSGDGKTLFFTWLRLNDTIDRACSYALFSVPVNDLKAAPAKVAACLPAGSYVQWSAVGIFVTGDDKALLVDAATGKVAAWKAPRPVEQVRGTPGVNNIQLSPDGRHLVFTAAAKDGGPQDASAGLLHVSDAAGLGISTTTHITQAATAP